MKYSTYIAQSLDGFIATKNGDTLWLHDLKIEGDCNYGAYYSQIDVIIMGYKTYEQILSFKIEWPYKDRPVYVLTDKDLLDKNIVAFNGPISELNLILKKNNYKHAWIVGGANVLDQYLAKGLVSTVRVTIAPILLGDGIRLFLPQKRKKLQLEQVTQCGYFVELVYSW